MGHRRLPVRRYRVQELALPRTWPCCYNPLRLSPACPDDLPHFSQPSRYIWCHLDCLIGNRWTSKHRHPPQRQEDRLGVLKSRNCSTSGSFEHSPPCERAGWRTSLCPYLLSSETTAKGTGLSESAGKEDPVELDSSPAL